MSTATPFRNVSVVLVDTLQPGNIGSAARAMYNMGLRRLKLVNPRGLLSAECLKMAGKAVDLVTSAGTYPTLEEAVAEESVVLGTTSTRDRQPRQRLYTPREAAALVWEYALEQPLALVFGSEKRGLSDAQLALCHYLVTIPSDPEYPVLNLAQAVLVMAYEIFAFHGVELNQHLTLASHGERERMFRHVEQVLTRVGFLSTDNPDHIMRAIRRFLGRADLTPRDIQIIRGVMTQMEWYASAGHELPEEKVRKP